MRHFQPGDQVKVRDLNDFPSLDNDGRKVFSNQIVILKRLVASAGTNPVWLIHEDNEDWLWYEAWFYPKVYSTTIERVINNIKSEIGI
jgi:hypothetical protein